MRIPTITNPSEERVMIPEVLSLLPIGNYLAPP